jgi:hypothetical protein
MALTEQYGEYLITYNEHAEKFVATCGGDPIASSAKLPELRKKLDKLGREEFARFKVLGLEYSSMLGGGGPGIVEYEVTNHAEPGYRNEQKVWVTNLSTKKRSATELDRLYADTPKNRRLLTQAVECYEMADAKRAEAERIAKKCERPKLAKPKEASQ